jgi:uncharacterized membrane protein
MNEKLKKILTIISIYLGSGFLAYILAPLGGMFHRLFWEYEGCGWWGPCDQGAYFEGFIYLFIYLLAVFSFSALNKKTAWKVYIAGTFLFWLAYIYLLVSKDFRLERKDNIGVLVIMLCAFALGYLSAFGIKKVRKKMKE